MKSARVYLRRVFAGGLLLAAARPASAQGTPSVVVKRTSYEDLQMFGQVLNQIRVNHPDSVDAHELFMAAIEGMIRAADPHSYVIPAMRLEPGKEQALRERKLISVPVTFAFVGGAPIVVSVAAGSAARQLDILPGDELIATDDTPVASASAEELDIFLAGKKGTTVKLTFERRRADGTLARLDRAVKRESVDEATVYSASGRKEEVTDTGRVQRSFWRSERRYPIVVMVNAGTASASELVAGALQDHDRALIVGRPTFGKSLLMRGFPMSDGSILVLVVGQVRTPCGRVVQRAYRTISRRDYYRLARTERDTAARPSCRTAAGRTVYGGGGIYPDIILAESPAEPRWLARVDEQQLILSWSGSYVDGKGASLGTLDAFVAGAPLPSATLADFRAYAGKQGVEIPADADALLQPELRRGIAHAKWGMEGAYRVDVMFDAAVRQAMAGFAEAGKLLGGTR